MLKSFYGAVEKVVVCATQPAHFRNSGETKVAEWEEAELTSPHEHTGNTPTCGATLTENKLETDTETLIQSRP